MAFGTTCPVCGARHRVGEPHDWTNHRPPEGKRPPTAKAAVPSVIKVDTGDEKDAIIATLRDQLAVYEGAADRERRRRETNAARMKAKREAGK